MTKKKRYLAYKPPRELCWICDKELVRSLDRNRALICSTHGSRGALHLREESSTKPEVKND